MNNQKKLTTRVKQALVKYFPDSFKISVKRCKGTACCWIDILIETPPEWMKHKDKVLKDADEIILEFKNELNRYNDYYCYMLDVEVL